MSDTSAGVSCASCGAPVSGNYCAACGEEVLDPRKRTVWHFITHSLIPELVNLDGRIWRTLRYLLFRPGFLSLEYAAGRHRSYVRPLRVLLVAIIAYVFAQGGLSFTLDLGFGKMNLAPAAMPLGRSIAGTIGQIDRFGVLERMFTAKMGPVESASDSDRDRFNETLRNFVTPVSFATVLVIAAGLYVLFHRRRPLLVEHAVFSMHCFSFVLLSSLLNAIAIRLGLVEGFVAIVTTILAVSGWQAAYLAVALRRFYWHHDRRRLVPWGLATGVAILFYVLNGVFLTGVQLLGGALAIWRL